MPRSTRCLLSLSFLNVHFYLSILTVECCIEQSVCGLMTISLGVSDAAPGVEIHEVFALAFSLRCSLILWILTVRSCTEPSLCGFNVPLPGVPAADPDVPGAKIPDSRRLENGDIIWLMDDMARFSLRGVLLKENARDTRLPNLKNTAYNKGDWEQKNLLM